VARQVGWTRAPLLADPCCCGHGGALTPLPIAIATFSVVPDQLPAGRRLFDDAAMQAPSIHEGRNGFARQALHRNGRSTSEQTESLQRRERKMCAINCREQMQQGDVY
jgi:hypothetical protein